MKIQRILSGGLIVAWTDSYKTFYLIPLLLLLASCAKAPEQIVVTETEFIYPNIPAQAAPKPVDMPDVEWFVVNEDNLEEAIERIKEAGGVAAFMAITPKGYENLSLGIADLRRYILQQKEIIAYYETQIQENTNKNK